MEKQEDDLLFHVFKAETGAKNDVWKKNQLKRHPYISNKIMGKPKWRYTVPILLIGKNKSGEKIYFVIHTSTAKLNLNNFIIDANNFTKKLGAEVEYVYFFNARIGKETEFKKTEGGEFLEYGTIKEYAKKRILNESLKLIKGTPREKIIRQSLEGKWFVFENREINSIIKNDQYTKEEIIFRDVSYKRKNKYRKD